MSQKGHYTVKPILLAFITEIKGISGSAMASNSPVKKSRFGQATSDATAMISAATSASNTTTITTVIASAV